MHLLGILQPGHGTNFLEAIGLDPLDQLSHRDSGGRDSRIFDESNPLSRSNTNVLGVVDRQDWTGRKVCSRVRSNCEMAMPLRSCNPNNGGVRSKHSRLHARGRDGKALGDSNVNNRANAIGIAIERTHQKTFLGLPRFASVGVNPMSLRTSSGCCGTGSLSSSSLT
jgi:hypothetical protein